MKKKVDHRAALELAMEHGRRDPDIAGVIEVHLKGIRMSNGRGWACKPERWERVAQLASYACQMNSLKLYPWERPVCHSNGVGDEPHAVLYRRLKAARISHWHPDPMAALEAAKET